MSGADESIDSVPSLLWNLLTSDEQMLFVLADDIHNGRVVADAVPGRLRQMRRVRRIKENQHWFQEKYRFPEVSP